MQSSNTTHPNENEFFEMFLQCEPRRGDERVVMDKKSFFVRRDVFSPNEDFSHSTQQMLHYLPDVRGKTGARRLHRRRRNGNHDSPFRCP